ncbi:DNA-binding GntR family transcriptional regulator [Microbacterium sp. AK009]|nr:DNA-binding GntR family transcriptional regulator [Microbacterium sp. AK009]
MRSESISRGLLSDQVYELLRSSILDKSRRPGSRLVESELARNLEVSQAPVREALKRLVHEGLVVSAPRRGSYVTEFSRDEFEVARQLRAVVEQLGAQLAARAVTEEELTDLDRVVEKMQDSVARHDWATFRLCDMEFHTRALELARQPVLQRVWSALQPALISQRAIGDPAFADSGETMVQWHADLVDVLRSGEADRAGEMFRAHASGALTPGQTNAP